MIESTYPLAKAVAPKVRAYFERLAIPCAKSAITAPTPNVSAIEEMIESAFWTSLRREEGYIPRISLAYTPPEKIRQPLLFGSPLTLDPQVLTRIAPAVEQPGIHLCVHQQSTGLSVWGIAQTLPKHCFVIEVIAPGVIAVKQSRDESSGKFANVAVLQGDEIKVIEQKASTERDCPSVLASLIGSSPVSGVDAPNVLVQFAIALRKHTRGGSLLVVPSSTDTWRSSILQQTGYSAFPPYNELSKVIEDAKQSDPPALDGESFHRSIEMIAGFTAVDGASIINDRYELLMFGAKITRREGYSLIEQVQLAEPIERAVKTVVHPSQLGGTRHLSAAQFAHDQHDAVALVASQDGRFTIFSWSSCENIVQAHRIETLLL